VQPGPRRKLVTASVLLGLFLGALEATAVAAAMPTVVGDLGGVAHYSWVFSAYLVAATATVPLYGKLADRHGRRLLYAVAVGLFCLGSVLSGAAVSMPQLIAFRAVQGLGAGGVFPVTITVIGDVFDLEERGRMQGVFSAVWGVSSLVGPALGGVVTDLLSWRWVFLLNVPFGIASAVILALYLEERPEPREHRLDLVGVAALVAAVTLLLFGVIEGNDLWGWTDPRTLALLVAAGAAGALFVRQERRAKEPMLPIGLLRTRLVALAATLSAGVGAIIYSASAFVPMFGQGVLRGTAIDAGLLLAPTSVGWPVASALAGRLLLRIGYRPLLIAGGVVASVGTAGLAFAAAAGGGRLAVMGAMLVVGFGLGLLNTPQLVAVQSAVPWRVRGAATSALQFFRSIAGAVAVAVFGALLNRRMADALAGVPLAPGDADALLDPALRASLPEATATALSEALRSGLVPVYAGLVVLAGVLLVAALAFPRGSARSLAGDGGDRR
jgi:EmrB/QacA subfamily drug resistance transporter